MTKRLIALSALTALLAAGCSSNRGGTSDREENPKYSPGTTQGQDQNVQPKGNMGGTSTAPGGSNSGRSSSSESDTNQVLTPDNGAAPGSQGSGNQHPQ